MTTDTVAVALGERSYNIHIGNDLLDSAGKYLTPLLRRQRVVVVTDENVLAAQGARLKSGLDAQSIEYEFVTLPPGEQIKSFAILEKLTNALLELDVERNDIVVAFGGGVIGDLTGFACSILRRGCRFAQLPTTLLAQVDSSVGGKTAINARHGKNLIGAFHQPDIVIADISTLNTLPMREIRAGYAEVLKYGFIADRQFSEWLNGQGGPILSGTGQKERQMAVKKSCETKAAIVSADEHEHGKRALLNFGHTFGHAFEGAFGYSEKLLHGEAVGLGMSLAFDYSVRIGMCTEDDAIKAKTQIAASGLPSKCADLKDSHVTAADLMRLMMQDKKREAGKLTLILAKGIGDAHIVKDVDTIDVLEFLKEKTAA